MTFNMFLILYQFMKGALQGGRPSAEAWVTLEAELAGESEDFAAYLNDEA